AEVEALDPEDRLVARKLEAGRELAGQSPRCPEHARRRVETSARGDVGREESCEPVRLLLDRRRPYEQPAPRTRSRQPPVVEQLRERTAHRDPADSVELAQVLLRFDRRALRAHALRDLR